MTRLRARVAERLKGAQNTYAMLTTFNEVDMTRLMDLRKEFKVGSAAAGQGGLASPGSAVWLCKQSQVQRLAELKWHDPLVGHAIGLHGEGSSPWQSVPGVQASRIRAKAFARAAWGCITWMSNQPQRCPVRMRISAAAGCLCGEAWRQAGLHERICEGLCGRPPPGASCECSH